MFGRPHYDKLTAELTSGPRVKTEATKDLEEIIAGMLDSNQYRGARYNSFDELEIIIGNRIYNLTLILQGPVDFEHVSLNDTQIQQYEDFILKHANNKPIVTVKLSTSDEQDNNNAVNTDSDQIPTAEYYEAQDPEGIHNGLSYAEKLAITLYTGLQYKEINDFLRTAGKFSVRPSDEMLDSEVKEILLATVFASHGLSRVSSNRNDKKQSFEELFRVEYKPVPQMHQLKNLALKYKKVLKVAGFTSTTTIVNTLANDVPQIIQNVYNNPDVSDATNPSFVILYQPISQNPISKNIASMAQNQSEREVLFPPRTQFKYFQKQEKKVQYANKETNEVEERIADIYHAIPVRSIDDIHPTAYVSSDVKLRSEILELLQRHIKNYETLINTDPKELAAIRSILQQEIAKQTEDNSKACLVELIPMLDNIILTKQLLEENKNLIPAINYVYQHHLKKPFKDKDKNSNDIEYSFADAVIYRPNHGLAHSLRVALLIPAVIAYLANFSKQPTFYQNLLNNPKKLNELQTVALFWVSGRESEVGFSENAELVKQYKLQSAKNLQIYFKKVLGMQDSDFKKYHFILLGKDQKKQSLYSSVGEKNNELQWLFNTIHLAHNLDLMRCYDLDAFNDGVAKRNRLVVSSNEEQEAWNNLLTLASDMIIATGDRMICSFDGTKMVSESHDYQPDRFVRASQEPTECLKMCLEIEAMIDPQHKKVSENDSNNNNDTSIVFQQKDLDTMLIALDNPTLGLVREKLIEMGANPKFLHLDNNQRKSAIETLTSSDEHFATWIFYFFKDALQANDLESIEACFKHNIQLTINTDTLNKILNYLVTNEKIDATKIFMLQGIDPFNDYRLGYNALITAINHDNPEMLKVLLSGQKPGHVETMVKNFITFLNSIPEPQNDLKQQFLALATTPDNCLGKLFDKPVNSLSQHAFKKFAQTNSKTGTAADIIVNAIKESVKENINLKKTK